MSFAVWLEETRLALWVGESDFAYPMLLSMHVVGLAIFAGLLTIVDLRLLGGLRPIPFAGLRGPMRMAWLGLAINATSGIALFTSQASLFIESTPFRIKLLMILLAAIAAGRISGLLKREAADWDTSRPAPASARWPALLSLVAIASAIVAGRLIAYF